jgi:hypothetical protein
MANSSWQESKRAKVGQQAKLAELADRTDWLELSFELRDLLEADRSWVSMLANSALTLGLEVLYNDLHTLQGNLKLYKAMAERIGTAANKQRFEETQQSSANLINAALAFAEVAEFSDEE